MMQDPTLPQSMLFEPKDLLNANEQHLLMDNSLGKSQFLLLLQNLHLDYENQLSTSQSLLERLKVENRTIHHRLHLQITEKEKQKLEENCKKNNQLIHYLLELQNLIFSNKKFFDWLRLQVCCEDELTLANEENANALENQAKKARTYPHPTPLHFTPLRTNPFG